MTEQRDLQEQTDEWNRQIDELFQIEHAFPTRWIPDETKPRPSMLRRVGNWIARGFGFGPVSVASEQGDDCR